MTGTKAETIRYYERIGLLSPPLRTAGNYRDYGQEDVGRLAFIRRARELGFSIDDVRTLLDLADQKQQSCVAVDAIAREHLVQVKTKIASLQALRRELDLLIRQCRHGIVADCRILEALGAQGAIRGRKADGRLA